MFRCYSGSIPAGTEQTYDALARGTHRQRRSDSLIISEQHVAKISHLYSYRDQEGTVCARGRGRGHTWECFVWVHAG